MCDYEMRHPVKPVQVLSHAISLYILPDSHGLSGGMVHCQFDDSDGDHTYAISKGGSMLSEQLHTSKGHRIWTTDMFPRVQRAGSCLICRGM